MAPPSFSISILDFLSQMYPPKSRFTEKDLPALNGKVYIITGSSSGVGKELARILYSKNATVYLAARSSSKASQAMSSIRESVPESTGTLTFLHLDLADLSTIKASANEFLSKETQLHVVFNNAGVMAPPQGSKTKQGYELQVGTNCIGTQMFTNLLTPLLLTTAKSSPPSSVRVIWVSSSAAEGLSPRSGINLNNLDYHEDKSAMVKYGISKAGDYLQGTEFGKRYKEDRVVSVPLNPGNLDSELYRTQGRRVGRVLRWLVLHPPVLGAYTELYAGLSPEVGIERTGEWVAPWGRPMKIRKDLVEASKSEAEGGTGVAEKFWEWNEEQIKPYL